MAIYNCYRHGRIRVEYLEILEYGDLPVTAPCVGGNPPHNMTLETPRDKSVDQRLKDAHEIVGRADWDEGVEECFECGRVLNDDRSCDNCGKAAQRE